MIRYIILTFIAILLIITGFAMKAEAHEVNNQITVKVVKSPGYDEWEKCNEQSRFPTRGDWKATEIGKFSNGKKLLLSNGAVDCIGGQVGATYMMLDETDINLEIIMHESVHMGQALGFDKEKQAYGTTKYFFETMNLLAKHNLGLVINIYLDELKKFINF